MPDDFLCDPPVDSKRYAVDPSDSAFNVMTSQYQPKHSYGYRGSSCSAPVGLCRQASSPGSFQEGNRNGVFLKFRCTVMKSARNLWKSCANAVHGKPQILCYFYTFCTNYRGAGWCILLPSDVSHFQSLCKAKLTIPWL